MIFYIANSTALCVVNLLAQILLSHWLTQNVQDGCQTVVVCVNFSKAFDVVKHDKLFTK